MIVDPVDELYGEPRALGRCTAGLHIFPDDNASLLRRAVEAAGNPEASTSSILSARRIGKWFPGLH